ncbi:MAG: hypothetical protein WB525_05040 [Pseudolabrys sp.]
MRRIADENHPAHMPLFELHPLHGRANDLIVALKRMAADHGMPELP